MKFPGIFCNTGAARGCGSSKIGSLGVVSYYTYTNTNPNTLNFDSAGMNIFGDSKDVYTKISLND